MSAQLATDAIFRPTGIAARPIIGASLTGSASDSGWYRIMPDGVTATRPAQDELMLDNLRADISGVNLTGWRVHIANDGYRQDRRIIDINSNVIKVKPVFHLGDADNLLGEDDIRYILTPRLLNPLNIHFDKDSQGTLEIAYSTDFVAPGGTGYSREVVSGESISPTLKTIMNLNPNTTLAIPSIQIQDLFYRFSNASDDNKIRWGEHLI